MEALCQRQPCRSLLCSALCVFLNNHKTRYSTPFNRRHQQTEFPRAPRKKKPTQPTGSNHVQSFLTLMKGLDIIAVIIIYNISSS